MNKKDESILIQMTDSQEFSPELLRLYDQAVQAWHRVSSGPLPTHTLLSIVAVSGSVKVVVPEPSLWDRIELHTPVIIKQNGGSPYEAEFVRRMTNGRLEVRELSSDEHKKAVLERFVTLKDEPDNPDWPQRFWGLKKGDLVHWAPPEGEVSEVKFQGVEPGGQVFIKAGKLKTKNEYVAAEEIVILDPAEAV